MQTEIYLKSNKILFSLTIEREENYYETRYQLLSKRSEMINFSSAINCANNFQSPKSVNILISKSPAIILQLFHFALMALNGFNGLHSL